MPPAPSYAVLDQDLLCNHVAKRYVGHLWGQYAVSVVVWLPLAGMTCPGAARVLQYYCTTAASTHWN